MKNLPYVSVSFDPLGSSTNLPIRDRIELVKDNYLNTPYHGERTEAGIKAELKNILYTYRMEKGLREGEPTFTHDCGSCRYLGDYLDFDFSMGNLTVNYYDLYYCDNLNKEGGVESVSLIARYSDVPADYLSARFFFNIPKEENTCLHVKLYKEIFDRRCRQCL